MTTSTPTRDDVKEFYGEAGDKPQAELCCPTIYKKDDISHIPKEVMEVSYGCGSPVSTAGMKAGETFVDLGSGGGVDCFIASKMVGSEGRVIGVDMTPQMMERGNKNAEKVAENLGYKNVEFRHGFLEDVPVESGTVDLVTSNCVVNLSTNKKKVFQEVHRILKSGGRFVIADIVADQPVPEQMKKDKKLWGECISGALTENEFLDYSAEAGFYGLQVLERKLFREVNGRNFWSVTLQAWKFNKGKKCVYVGQKATYLGPFSQIKDDEDHTFQRGVALEVCTDTALKLSRAPYKDQFLVTDPNKKENTGEVCCAPSSSSKGSECC